MLPVPTSFRRLLAVLLLTGTVVLLAPAGARAACTCESRTVTQQAKAADVVLLGTVDTVLTRTRRAVTYDVQVQRVYKGPVATETVEVETPRGRRSCGLGDLPRGEPLVVFASVDGTATTDPTWTADRCSGTGAATGALQRRVEDIFGEGRTPVPPAPDEARLTRVADEAPATFTRTAAPGLAMVIAGLLGLLLVRRLGR